MKKNRRRLFSDSDGSKIGEDLQAISEQFKAWFEHLPLEIKKLMPIAEKAVHFLQELDDMLEDGMPVNEAIERVLTMTKSEVDDKAYEVFKTFLTRFAEYCWTLINDFDGVVTGEDKFMYASDIISSIEGATGLQADTAAQLAVYAYKS